MNKNSRLQVDAKATLSKVYDRALVLQQPIAEKNVARLRRVHPEKTPAELIKSVNSWYLGVVSTSGAGAGAAAAVPNGIVQVPVALADLATYTEASVLYTLTVMEIHGVHVEDLERRRMLVTAVMLGSSASSRILDGILGKAVPYWGKKIVNAIPLETIKQVNKVMGPRFVTKWGAKQGVLVLGKQIPFMLGATVGGAGNGLFGWFVIKAGREILGPPPETWKDEIPTYVEGEVVD